MAVEYLIRYVLGTYQYDDLQEACTGAANDDYHLAHVKPVMVEGSVTGWMLFFERPK